jgi:hypothetical protein
LTTARSKASVLAVLVLLFAASPGSARKMLFTEVSREAGIDFLHRYGDTQLRNILEETGSGASFVDYDNDGDLDAYLVNCAHLFGPEPPDPYRNGLYRNEGDGTFTHVTLASGLGDTGYGMGAVFADYDNDGDKDVYITNWGPNAFYVNNGDGTFTEFTKQAGVEEERWSVSSNFFDYDKDGLLDLFVSNYLQFSLDSKAKRSMLSFQEGYRVFPGPRDYEGTTNRLFHNKGDGTFEDVSRESGIYMEWGKGMSSVAADYDGDGDYDLFVANDRLPNFLYRNKGDGTFEETGIQAGVAFDEDGDESGAMGSDFADFDGDGKMDLLVSNMIFEYNSLFRNRGDGTFEDIAVNVKLAEDSYRYVCWGTNLIDLDNDGYRDIFLATGHVQDYIDMFSESITYEMPSLLYMYDGQGSFENYSKKAGKDITVPTVGRGTAFGDYDLDGDIDILVNNSNRRPSLFRNDSETGHWIRVHVEGTESNRDGVGALVRVTAGERTQLAEVKSGSSYMSQSDGNPHFGLGELTVVDRIEVRWPSGKVDVIEDVPADRVVTIVEGSSPAS